MDFLLRVLVLLVASLWVTQTKVLSAPRQGRLSVLEPQPTYYYTNIDGKPGTYSFGYDVTDPATGNNQFRTEERYPNGTVVGSYGYLDARRRLYRYSYVADQRGYRVMQVKPYSSQVASPPAEPRPQDEVTWSRKKKPTKMQTWTPGKGTQRKQASYPRENSLQRPVHYSYS